MPATSGDSVFRAPANAVVSLSANYLWIVKITRETDGTGNRRGVACDCDAFIFCWTALDDEPIIEVW